MGKKREGEARLGWLATVPCSSCKPKPPITLHIRPEHGAIALICTHAYEIREALKDRGWIYSAQAIVESKGGVLDLLARPAPAWVFMGTPKMCGPEIAALDHIAPGHLTMEHFDPLENALSSLIEGRPDIIPRL